MVPNPRNHEGQGTRQQQVGGGSLRTPRMSLEAAAKRELKGLVKELQELYRSDRFWKAIEGISAHDRKQVAAFQKSATEGRVNEVVCGAALSYCVQYLIDWSRGSKGKPTSPGQEQGIFISTKTTPSTVNLKAFRGSQGAELARQLKMANGGSSEAIPFSALFEALVPAALLGDRTPPAQARLWGIAMENSMEVVGRLWRAAFMAEDARGIQHGLRETRKNLARVEGWLKSPGSEAAHRKLLEQQKHLRLEEAGLSAAARDGGGPLKIKDGQIVFSVPQDKRRDSQRSRDDNLAHQRDMKMLKEHFDRWKDGSIKPVTQVDEQAAAAWRNDLTFNDFTVIRTHFGQALLEIVDSAYGTLIEFRSKDGQLIISSKLPDGPERSYEVEEITSRLTRDAYQFDRRSPHRRLGTAAKDGAMIVAHAVASLEQTLAPEEEYVSTPWVVERPDSETVTARIATEQEREVLEAANTTPTERIVNLRHEESLSELLTWLETNGGSVGGQPGGPTLAPKQATIAVYDYLDDVYKLAYPPSRQGEPVPPQALGKHVVMSREIGGYMVRVPIVVPHNVAKSILWAPGVNQVVGGMEIDGCHYGDPR